MAADAHECSAAVFCAEAVRLGEAAALATRLSLPLIHNPEPRFDFLLTLTAARLELRACGADAPGPVYAEFITGAFGYRRFHGFGLKQPLARAIGVKSRTDGLYVVDCTAGLGRDAFLLALLGCRVALLERCAIVHALLSDGLSRASSALQATHPGKLTLIHQDACAYLETLEHADYPDVIYLDPMYPQRDRSALNRKDMRMLRGLVGGDDDASGLLSKALTRGQRRVTVKRPRLAPAITGPSPTFHIEAKTTRFDVYMTRKNMN